MAHIVVFSLDYDGCADILFKEIEEKHGLQEIGFQKKEFSNYLDRLSKEAKQVEVYVGSNRQSHFLNKLSNKNNKNGDCFKNYAELCKNKNWIFKKLLLADIKYGEKPGTAMDKEPWLGVYVSYKSKIQILKYQLKEVGKNHPDDTVDFYFFDDDCENIIFSSLLKHISGNEGFIPKNVNLIFVKQSWAENCPAQEIARIKRREECIALPPEAKIAKNEQQFFKPKEAAIRKVMQGHKVSLEFGAHYLIPFPMTTIRFSSSNKP